MLNKNYTHKLLIFTIAFMVFFLFQLQAQNLGDVNGDGSVGIVDALMVAQYYVGLKPSPFNSSKADVNCDGGIDIVDALLLAQYYVGLIDPFQCESTPDPTIAPTLPPAPTSDPSKVAQLANDQDFLNYMITALDIFTNFGDTVKDYTNETELVTYLTPLLNNLSGLNDEEIAQTLGFSNTTECDAAFNNLGALKNTLFSRYPYLQTLSEAERIELYLTVLGRASVTATLLDYIRIKLQCNFDCTIKWRAFIEILVRVIVRVEFECEIGVTPSFVFIRCFLSIKITVIIEISYDYYLYIRCIFQCRISISKDQDQYKRIYENQQLCRYRQYELNKLLYYQDFNHDKNKRV